MLKYLFTVFVLFSSHAHAAELRIAAASDLRYAMEELAKKFEAQNPGAKLDIVFGASGAFFQQISNGAPFDIFLSADSSFPSQLQAKGLISGAPFQYGSGRLVLWTRNETNLKLSDKDGIQNAANEKLKKISIANPKTAPYGMAAEKALAKTGIDKKIGSKIVVADSVAQAAQYAQSGATDAGLIALALAVSPALSKAGHYIVLNEAEPLQQAGVILKRSKEQKTASAFQAFLMSEESQKLLSHYGFEKGQQKIAK